jgi:alpha,alpha-trehalose phosphorylase
VHIASLGGAVMAAVAGLGGLRDHTGSLSFSPRLPQELHRVAFPMTSKGRRLHVELRDEQATYTLAADAPGSLTFAHWGEEVELEPGATATRPLPEPPELEPLTQPAGRAPQRRRDQVTA